MYNKDYGLWEVTTEGDCEGKSTRKLGVYEGFIDDIAFALVGSCCYSLRFKPFSFNDLPIPQNPKQKVSVMLDIDSGTWNMDNSERKQFFAELLKGRKVSVSDGQYYASVTLSRNDEYIQNAKRQAALSKLTVEEKKLLGLYDKQ